MFEWMEEFGFKELRAMHKDAKAEGDCVSFDEFVRESYNCSANLWVDEMFEDPKSHLVSYDMMENEEEDICLASAILVLAQIINAGIKDGFVADIILKEELAPDHEASVEIKNDFVYKIIPLINETLKGSIYEG